jgi:hypothetical protein
MQWKKQLLAMGYALVLLPAAARAATCSAPMEVVSGPRSIPLVELYTSEGCDSCPPADRWLSTLSAKKLDVAPLAFHVDYWDYIGWKDRFAQAKFTDRQRHAVALQGSRTVYTPQVMMDGRDARQWSSAGAFDGRVRELSNRTPRATITLRAQPLAQSAKVTVEVALINPSDSRDAALFVALTENNLVSRVTAGENRGVTLKHDFVVRDFSAAIPVEGGRMVREHTIALPADAKPGDLSVVAFVQDMKSGDVLQALRGALCAP